MPSRSTQRKRIPIGNSLIVVRGGKDQHSTRRLTLPQTLSKGLWSRRVQGGGGGESTEVSPKMALNPVLIASWTSAEVKTALFDAVIKKHVLPAEVHYVHMTFRGIG